MDHQKIFRILNHFDHSFVTCTQCNRLLRGHVFTLDALQYCAHCAGPEYPRNHVLEEIFKAMIFPCEQKGCDFLGTQEELVQHEANCYYNTFVCSFCKQEINEPTAIQHLRDEHQQFLFEEVLDDPEKTLPLIITPSTHMFLLTLNVHVFLVLTQFKDDVLTFYVAKTQQLEAEHSDTFQILFVTDTVEMSLKGVVSNMRQVLGTQLPASPTQISKSTLPDDLTKQRFTIYFNDFKLLKDIMDTCPICLSSISSELYQCVNNHSVCASCRPNMKVCPTCRGRMNDVLVNLRYTMSKVPYACTNDGCIHFVRGDLLKEHLLQCPFRFTICDECKQPVAKCNIFKHMNTHLGVIKNFECIDVMGVEEAYKGKSRYSYLVYDRELFKCTLSVVKTMPRRLCIHVQLLFCDDEARAQRYRYAVQVMADANEVHSSYAVWNACQSCQDNEPSSMINFNMLKAYLHEDNVVKFRFFIYKPKQNI